MDLRRIGWLCCFIFIIINNKKLVADDYYTVSVLNRVPVINWYRYNSTEVRKRYVNKDDCNYWYDIVVYSNGNLYRTHSEAGGYMFPVWSFTDETGLSLTRDDIPSCVSFYNSMAGYSDYSVRRCYELDVNVNNLSNVSLNYKVVVSNEYTGDDILLETQVSPYENATAIIKEYNYRSDYTYIFNLYVEDMNLEYQLVDTHTLTAVWGNCDSYFFLEFEVPAIQLDFESPFDNEGYMYYPDNEDVVGQKMPEGYKVPTYELDSSSYEYESYEDDSTFSNSYTSYTAPDSPEQLTSFAYEYGTDGSISEEDLYSAMRKALNDEGNMYEGPEPSEIDNGDFPSEFDNQGVFEGFGTLTDNYTNVFNTFYEKITSISVIKLPRQIGSLDNITFDFDFDFFGNGEDENLQSFYTIDFTEEPISTYISLFRNVAKWFLDIVFYFFVLIILRKGVA